MWAFSKIESREDALKMVKYASTVFMVCGAAFAFSNYKVGSRFFFLCEFFVFVGGVFLHYFHSRVASVALLAINVVAAGVIFGFKAGALYGDQRGASMMAVMVYLLFAIRAIEATFKLHGRFSEEWVTDEP